MNERVFHSSLNYITAFSVFTDLLYHNLFLIIINNCKITTRIAILFLQFSSFITSKYQFVVAGRYAFKQHIVFTFSYCTIERRIPVSILLQNSFNLFSLATIITDPFPCHAINNLFQITWNCDTLYKRFSYHIGQYLTRIAFE